MYTRDGETPPQPAATDYLLRLRPARDDVAAILRLGRLLKALGRQYGFRCVRAIEVPQGQKLSIRRGGFAVRTLG